MLLTCIPKEQGSNLGHDIYYPHLFGFPQCPDKKKKKCCHGALNSALAALLLPALKLIIQYYPPILVHTV